MPCPPAGSRCHLCETTAPGSRFETDSETEEQLPREALWARITSEQSKGPETGDHQVEVSSQ